MNQKTRVLIVDNQPRARQSMSALLNAWYQALEIREAANGEDAVQAVEEFQPDLILMDVRMPKLNGLQASWIIKSRWPKIKIIILSMHPEFKAEALSAGAVFINKNDLPEKLREILADLIDKDFRK